MVYVDTSAIVKLYVKEAYSREVSHWIRANDEAIPLTRLHELEFANALSLKRFRHEMSAEQQRVVSARLDAHLGAGIFFRPPCSWSDAWGAALDLSRQHTDRIGSRSLVILHVALARVLEAERFLTFDERQAELCVACGLQRVVLGSQAPSEV